MQLEARKYLYDIQQAAEIGLLLDEHISPTLGLPEDLWTGVLGTYFTNIFNNM